MLAILEGVTLDRESLGRQLWAIRSRARAGLTLTQIRGAIDEGRP